MRGRNRSAWDQLSDVEILGDPAVKVAEIDESLSVKYKGKEYKNADRINVGVSGVAEVAAWAGPGNPGVPFQFAVPVSTPTKVYRVTVPSFIAPFLVFSSVKIGPTELIDGQPICGDIWSEVSENNAVDWPTAETSQTITFTGQSFATAAVTMRQPRITLYAVRLR